MQANISLSISIIGLLISKDLLGFQGMFMLATAMILAICWPTMYGTKEAKATWHYIFQLHKKVQD